MATLHDANVKFREVTGQHGGNTLFIQLGIAPPQNVADQIFLSRWVVANSIQEEAMLSNRQYPLADPATIVEFVPRISTDQSRADRTFSALSLPGGQQVHPGVAGAYGFYSWNPEEGTNTDPWKEFSQVLMALPSANAAAGAAAAIPEVTRLD